MSVRALKLPKAVPHGLPTPFLLGRLDAPLEAEFVQDLDLVRWQEVLGVFGAHVHDPPKEFGVPGILARHQAVAVDAAELAQARDGRFPPLLLKVEAEANALEAFAPIGRQGRPVLTLPIDPLAQQTGPLVGGILLEPLSFAIAAILLGYQAIPVLFLIPNEALKHGIPCVMQTLSELLLFLGLSSASRGASFRWSSPFLSGCFWGGRWGCCFRFGGTGLFRGFTGSGRWFQFWRSAGRLNHGVRRLGKGRGVQKQMLRNGQRVAVVVVPDGFRRHGRDFFDGMMKGLLLLLL